MLLWTSLLILVSVNGQAPAAKKAVVIPNPPWTPVFTGEKVTLTCNGSHLLDPNTVWQVYGRQWHKTSRPLEVTKAGEYRCQTEDSSLSKPVYVVFSKDALILQILYTVFEGDTLLLKCRGRNDIQLTEISYYKDKKSISGDNENSMFSIPHASSSHNGVYYCKAKGNKWYYQDTSREAKLQVQELFAPPELKTTISDPTEGTPVTLSCETQLPPQRSNTKLHFSFFREGKVIASDWKESQVLQIPAIWREDSGLYWCEAKAMTQNIWKQSNHVKISVKRIPVSGILLETQPLRTQLIEGEKLVLNCSVAEGTGNITFCLHKNVSKDCLRKKTEYSLKKEFVFSTIKKSDEGSYWCTADNNNNTISSRTVVVTVMIPVSHPILTLSAAGMQAVVGEVLQFQCEVLKGAAPIFYQFYHKGLVLKTILAPFGGAVSFNLSVTTEHSGDYSCKANNSFSSQLSEMLELSILDPAERGLLIMGIIVSLLGILGLVAIAILVYSKLKRKSGRSPVSEPSRDRPITDPQESGHSNSVPPVELQPIYDNVTPFIEDVVYTEVWNMQQGKRNTADTSETPPEDKDSVTYSEVKTHSPNNSRGKDKSMDGNCEDGTENYENILLS
ncbi:Fc receptor-like protein 2 [Trichosurus vulpecula]|uniref:Fc receptor-like protein 2 n=1 Tax=Trichosurus vulpecula TaxID=9337 RepID=UPI00186B3D06|nr:Fc receptor-like protein 2 [Trichosurus vulpecula]